MVRLQQKLTLFACAGLAIASLCGHGLSISSAADDATTQAASDEASRFENARERIEDKLKQPLPAVEFHEIPLNEVIDYIASSIEVDIILSKRFFEDYGIELDTPITLQLNYGKISAETLFELIYEQIGCPEAGISIRDEIIYISDQHSGLETVVYDCSDLLPLPPPAENELGSANPIDDISLVAMPPHFTSNSQSGSSMPVQFSSICFSQAANTNLQWQLWPAGQLVYVIRATVSPRSWEMDGGFGTIEFFEELLVVKNTPAVHREIEELLAMMRKARKAASAKQSDVPATKEELGVTTPAGVGFF